MKSFKIKKRNERKSVFIVGPPIASFPKPKIGRFYFNDTTPPALYKPQFKFEIIVVEPEQQVAVVAASELDWASLEWVGAGSVPTYQEPAPPLPEAASETA